MRVVGFPSFLWLDIGSCHTVTSGVLLSTALDGSIAAAWAAVVSVVAGSGDSFSGLGGDGELTVVMIMMMMTMALNEVLGF